MSSSREDRGIVDALSHFAEAQGAVVDGVRALVRGIDRSPDAKAEPSPAAVGADASSRGIVRDLVDTVSGIGRKREAEIRLAVLETIRDTLVTERDALGEDDAVTRRAFDTVAGVLEREIERTGGDEHRERGPRIRTVPVE